VRPSPGVRVRRVYDHPEAADGARVLVDRIWPRGLRKDALRLDDWAKDVAPSTALRTWYAHDPAKFDEFRQRYLGELTGSSQQAALGRLRAAQRETSGLVGRRHELWGLLGAYRAMADRSGGAEDPGLATEYERAERLLHTAPCPLTAATDAVTRYQQAVLTFTGRRH